jgi:hypothetical protein
MKDKMTVQSQISFRPLLQAVVWIFFYHGHWLLPEQAMLQGFHSVDVAAIGTRLHRKNWICDGVSECVAAKLQPR